LLIVSRLRSGEIVIQAVVRGSKCYASWKSVPGLLEGMELLRRLLYSSLEPPLPQDWGFCWDVSLKVEYYCAETSISTV
jgi:hypothetical protein